MDKFKQYSKQLRSNMPDAEKVIWYHLRAGRFRRLKFRRQVRIGTYIVDFVCFSQRLIIELDGSQHAVQKVYDEKRTRWLNAEGYRVVRFWNNEVFENLEGVLEAIGNHCLL